jgi:hypothetical protein
MAEKRQLRICSATKNESVYHLAYDGGQTTKCNLHVDHFTLIPLYVFGKNSDVEWCPKCGKAL